MTGSHSDGMAEALLVITGTMGAGKTALLGEASDLLAMRGIVHAAIDVDALGLAHLPAAAASDDVMYANLRSVCENYAALGVRRFVLARAISDRNEFELYREMIPAARTVVCRLTANLETMKRRVQQRELGIARQEYVDRVAKLGDLLDRANLEDFAVINENRSLTEVAGEMLAKAEWI